jgi:trehalose 6-phosphate phosphatase
LIAFDFDGTLSPIVPRPEDAALDPALSPLLERLRPAVGWLAVISGRDRDFLAARLKGMLMLGSYGLELPPELSPTGFPAGFQGERVRADLAAARGKLEAAVARYPGSRLEVKPWGLALHYRGAGADFDEARAAELATDVAERHGLKVQQGRLVLELKPGKEVDKGWAMRLLVQRLDPSAVVFAGDDLGDRPAWEAVRAMPLAGLAVGIKSPELPEDALADCNVVLTGRSELAPFMKAMIQAGELGDATSS